ncbi:MAG: hypothetical protein C5B47_08510, partial [Verrucomicrobia bacterium]
MKKKAILVSYISILISVSPVSAEIPTIDHTGVGGSPKPSWETQKQARTYQLLIPAPRGQIVDRNGDPL